MSAQNSDLENHHELKFSRQQGFLDRSLSIRLLIVLVFTAVVFFVLHFREVRVEMYELGTIAPSYVVAQEDFDFLDEEATSILKQDAVRDIGRIYQFEDKELRMRHMEFENFLIYNQDWRKYVESTTFEQMFNAADALEKRMMKLRFTDPRTMQRLKEVGMDVSDFIIYTPEVDISEPITLPDEIWNELTSKAFPAGSYSETASEFILSFFKNRPWTIQEDIPTERLVRKRIQAAIPDRFTHVSAGTRIIDQGERVTPRHIAMLQAMKKTLNEKRNLWHPLTLLGSAILATIFTIVAGFYFKYTYPLIYESNRKLALVATVMMVTLLIGKIIELLILSSQTNVIDVMRYPIVIPFAGILLTSLMNPGVAIYASGYLALVLTVALAFERQGFLILNLVVAIVVILSAQKLKHRRGLFMVCAKGWISCVLLILALLLAQNTFTLPRFIIDSLSAGLYMFMTAIVVAGLLPLLESTFRVMTNVTLTEYMDPNNDLLRRLTIEAPGTYQHSVVVGNVAEAAAVAIGANGLFCRVATLYHDVGKMATPQYFTENQASGMNIHQLLTPQESAAVIIAHVSDGVAMARKAGLPEPFIDIIKEHHGTTLVYYFYHKQLNRVGGDRSKVNETEFRYAGPKPRSKESAIIMLADTVEAASRSVDVFDEKNLMVLADRLVREKQDDGQFDNCLLTLEELSIVKATLVKTLIAFGHSRVKYPHVQKESPKDVAALNYEA